MMVLLGMTYAKFNEPQIAEALSNPKTELDFCVQNKISDAMIKSGNP